MLCHSLSHLISTYHVHLQGHSDAAQVDEDSTDGLLKIAELLQVDVVALQQALQVGCCHADKNEVC
jgi:hypothetical protein